MNVQRSWGEVKCAPLHWGGDSLSKIKATRQVNFSRVDAREMTRRSLRKIDASSLVSGRVDCPIFGGRGRLENEKIIAIWLHGGLRHGVESCELCGSFVWKWRVISARVT